MRLKDIPNLKFSARGLKLVKRIEQKFGITVDSLDFFDGLSTISAEGHWDDFIMLGVPCPVASLEGEGTHAEDSEGCFEIRFYADDFIFESLEDFREYCEKQC